MGVARGQAPVAGRYSVIIPVRNEARTLRRTLPHLLAATQGDPAELIFVCNGCRDDSAAVITAVNDPRIVLLQADRSGKCHALNLGLDRARQQPVFFLDADVQLAPGTFRRLIAALEEPGIEMVSPRICFDLTRASRAARAVARVWLALPHARCDAFHHLIGVSGTGRRRWDRFPDVMGDDAYLCAVIPGDARRIVDDCALTTRPPSTLRAWIAVRARWIRGERELRARGQAPVRTIGQRRALVRLVRQPGMAGPTLLYLAVRLCAAAMARLPARDWFRDRPD